MLIIVHLNVCKEISSYIGCALVVNLSKTSPEYTQAGAYGKCVLFQSKPSSMG